MTDDDPRHADDSADGDVMRSLMDAYPALMTVDELRRDLREPEACLVTDSINRLDSAGLIHRFGDFIYPTRAAYLAGRLEYTSS
jgi:predicted transcriptional regulator